MKMARKEKSPRKQNAFITKLWITSGCFWSLFSKLPLLFKIPCRKPFSRQKSEELEGSDFLMRWQSWGGNPDLCVLLSWLLLLAAAKETELFVWFSADCLHCDSQNSCTSVLHGLSLCLVKTVASGYLTNAKRSGGLFCSTHRTWLPSR